MNRKILAGAAASLMLTSLPVAITSAGAGAVKPTVTSVAFTHDANHQFLAAGTVAANETFTIVVTGTGFNSGSYSLAAKATPGITANSITKNSSTQVTIVATSSIGIGLTKALKDVKYTLTVPSGGNSVGGTVKFTSHFVSNCGPTLPLAVAGKTYSTDGNGSMIINADGTGWTGTDAATTYFDVNLLGTNPLCTGDVLGFTEPPVVNGFGFSQWGINYPINVGGATAARLSTNKHGSDFGFGHINNLGFNFPYTSASHLKVIGSVTTYKLVGVKAIAGCAADDANTVAIQSCVVTPKSVIVTSNATREYDQGDTIQSPIIKLTGLGAKSSPVQIIPVSNVSTIDLGGNTLDITFAPRPKSANASYAPVSFTAAS
jgi:hypothetical protein